MKLKIVGIVLLLCPFIHLFMMRNMHPSSPSHSDAGGDSNMNEKNKKNQNKETGH